MTHGPPDKKLLINEPPLATTFSLGTDKKMMPVNIVMARLDKRTFILMFYQLSPVIPMAALAFEVTVVEKLSGAPIPLAKALATDPLTVTKTE